MPKISVILPVYNAEKYLRSTLESLLLQTFEDFEVIAVNDGSKDGSLAILTEYAAKDKRIKIIDKANGGVSAARNTAIEAAQGNYLAFIDADDIYSPEYLARMYSSASETGADVTVCDYVTFRGEKPIFPECEKILPKSVTVRELLDTGLMTSMCIKLIKQKIFTDYDICFSTAHRYSEDLFCSWKVCAASDKICVIYDKLYGYRLTGAGATSKCYKGLYDQYKIAFDDIRAFLSANNLSEEKDNLDLSFTRGIPAFLLMIAREKRSIKAKIREIKRILEDGVISCVVAERFEDISVNKRSKKIFTSVKKKHTHCLLMHGYYMNLRLKIANVLKR